jgi:hypothetical protein
MLPPEVRYILAAREAGAAQFNGACFCERARASELAVMAWAPCESRAWVYNNLAR